jgi:hypothetical protein
MRGSGPRQRLPRAASVRSASKDSAKRSSGTSGIPAKVVRIGLSSTAPTRLSDAAPDRSIRRPGSGWFGTAASVTGPVRGCASSGVRASAEPTRARGGHGPVACSSSVQRSPSTAGLTASARGSVTLALAVEA